MVCTRPFLLPLKGPGDEASVHCTMIIVDAESLKDCMLYYMYIHATKPLHYKWCYIITLIGTKPTHIAFIDLYILINNNIKVTSQFCSDVFFKLWNMLLHLFFFQPLTSNRNVVSYGLYQFICGEYIILILASINTWTVFLPSESNFISWRT